MGGRRWACGLCRGELVAACDCCAPPLCNCAGAVEARRSRAALSALAMLAAAGGPS